MTLQTLPVSSLIQVGLLTVAGYHTAEGLGFAEHFLVTPIMFVLRMDSNHVNLVGFGDGLQTHVRLPCALLVPY